MCLPATPPIVHASTFDRFPPDHTQTHPRTYLVRGDDPDLRGDNAGLEEVRHHALGGAGLGAVQEGGP